MEEKKLFKDPNFLVGLLGGIALISFIGFIVVCVALARGNGGTVAGATDNNTTGQTNTSSQQTAGTVSIDDLKGLFKLQTIQFGKASSKNIFVEFSDPSCPYCQIAGGKNPELNRQVGDRFKLTTDGGSYLAPVPAMKKMVDEGKAAFIYVYTNGHGNGELAAQALYCAYEKGKFWEADDLLSSSGGYELMNGAQGAGGKLTADQLAVFLKSAVDENFMKDCLSKGKYADRISRDAGLAQQFGVSGTPGFFVNGQRFDGAYSFTDMQSALAK